MRIIAGRFKGRRLVNFKADHIRPTTDRVKESIFNKLQGYVQDARVLDLFSGTGNMACEAVSRGAVKVDAVEISKKSLAIMRENIELLSIDGEVTTIAGDVIRYVEKYEGTPYDLVIADPPFTEKIAHRVMEALANSKCIGPNTVIVIESSSHEKLLEKYVNLVRDDERDYGDKRVTFWKMNVEES